MRVLPFAVLAIAGCTPLTYIGNSAEVGTADMPKGFSISPGDAVSIVNLNTYPEKIADDVYHDDRNYYLISSGFNGFKGSTASDAKRHGHIVDGTSGKLYDRATDRWIVPGSERWVEPGTSFRQTNAQVIGED